MQSQRRQQAPADWISKQLPQKSWIRPWAFHSTVLSYGDTWDKMYENGHVFEVVWFICIGFSNGGETKGLASVQNCSAYVWPLLSRSPALLWEPHPLHKSLPSFSLVFAPTWHWPDNLLYSIDFPLYLHKVNPFECHGEGGWPLTAVIGLRFLVSASPVFAGTLALTECQLQSQLMTHCSVVLQSQMFEELENAFLSCLTHWWSKCFNSPSSVF